MSRRRDPSEVECSDENMEVRHLRREARTALELAVVASAPSELVDKLAVATGLLEAVSELPPDAAPMVVLVPKLVKRSRAALEEWSGWQAEHLGKTKV